MKFFRTISRCLILGWGIILAITGCFLGSNRLPNPKKYFTDPDVLALVKAAQKGDIKTIDRLVDEGVDVNTKGKGDATPLIFALIARNEAGFQRLLEHGADPNSMMEDSLQTGYIYVPGSQTPMSLSAAVEESSTFLRLCLKHGGDPNWISPLQTSGTAPIFNGDGATPLFNAVGGRNLDNVKILIKAGANVNYQEKSGKTPAIYASMEFYAAVYELLQAGADWQLKNFLGRDLVSYCISDLSFSAKRYPENREYRKKVLDFLRDKGVDLEAARKLRRQNNPKLP